MTARRLLLPIALPLALAGQDTTAAKATLLDADRAASASAAALAQALLPEAAVLLPGLDILRGRTEYDVHLASIALPAAGHAPWTPSHAVVSRDGGFGCTTGVLQLAAVDSTQPSTGRYAACWSRDREGTWRMLVLARAFAPAQVQMLPDTIASAPGSWGVPGPGGTQAVHLMRQADRHFAAFSADSIGPAGAFARWIAADGMILGSLPVPLRGPAQARTAFAGFPLSGRFAWDPSDDLGQASVDGSLGFTVGEARIARSKANVYFSKYLTVWRRESDGSYRFVFDIGSDRPVPASR